MRIRWWAFLGWLIVVLGSIIMARVVVVLTGQGDQQDNTAAFATILPVLTTNRSHWPDPVWQNTLQDELKQLKINVVLLDSADHELYHSASIPSDTNAVQKIVLLDNGQPVGSVHLFGIAFIWLPYAVTYIIVQFTTLLIAGLFIGHSVLRPLASMSRAARQIAQYKLDFDLPLSRVREVSEVATAFRDMRDALRGALTRQAELEQERRFFISAVAHDLRTPLFALRGYLEGLERGLAATPEKASHYIAVCQEKADVLERLIADLFAYSRLEYLDQTPQPESFDFSQLIRQAADNIHIQTQDRAITLYLEGTPCLINADKTLLARVLDNLLDNALRYTPPHGIIRLCWHCENGSIHFTVTDTGLGIADKDMPYLFDPLYRGEISRSRDTGGAGLGLTIARRILRAHGGDLSVANVSTGGAMFTGTLKQA